MGKAKDLREVARICFEALVVGGLLFVGWLATTLVLEGWFLLPTVYQDREYATPFDFTGDVWPIVIRILLRRNGQWLLVAALLIMLILSRRPKPRPKTA